jgi:hypothetical protein
MKRALLTIDTLHQIIEKEFAAIQIKKHGYG